MPKQNIVGPQVRKLRVARGWSQEELAGQLQRAGWQIMRGTLAKIESQVRCVSDAELMALSRALKVPVERLFADANKR